MISLLLTLTTVSSLLGYAEAAASTNASAVCNEIYDQIPDYLAFDPLGEDAAKSIGLNANYTESSTTYWDAANAQDRPACIVFPAGAAHVSVAIKALNRHEAVPFAIKSGGHQFNRGWSSSDGGVLISFRPNLAGT